MMPLRYHEIMVQYLELYKFMAIKMEYNSFFSYCIEIHCLKYSSIYICCKLISVTFTNDTTTKMTNQQDLLAYFVSLYIHWATKNLI